MTASNSLVGTQVHDEIGGGAAVELDNGAYALWSGDYDNGSIEDGGAVSVGGRYGVRGPVSSANSVPFVGMKKRRTRTCASPRPSTSYTRSGCSSATAT